MDRYVGYPRVASGLRYGTADRLQALASFYDNFALGFTGGPVLCIFLSGCAAFYALNHNPLLMVGLVVGALMIYAVSERLIADFARILGKQRGFSKAIPFLLIALGTEPYFDKRALGTIGELLICVVGSLAMLMIANMEIRRYGIKLPSFSDKKRRHVFAEAIESRRAWEMNPYPAVPLDMMSGDPPRIQ